MMGEARKGDWMQTASGRQFWPLDPRADEIDIEDIAHALSLICRFGGHARTLYSVAEHSVRVSMCAASLGAEPWHQRAALLHDGAEAYIGDMVRPLKRTRDMLPFRQAEERIERAICERFALVSLTTPLIKTADEILLATEARDIMGGQSADKWNLFAQPLESKIEPWTPKCAEKMFLALYSTLTDTRTERVVAEAVGAGERARGAK